MYFNFPLVLSFCIEVLSSLFGVVFAFSLILYGLQKLNKHLLVTQFGFKSLYPTAVIGTPIHELSHAILAVFFRHEVAQVKLFAPDPKTGVLGYVQHGYRNTIYQICGCFFIGIAPLLMGAAVIFLANMVFFPEVNKLFLAINEKVISGGFSTLLSSFIFFEAVSIESFQGIWFALSDASFKDILWVYLIIAVSVHMGPSTADLRNALPGVLALSIIIILLAVIFQSEISYRLLSIREAIGIFTKILLIACYANLAYMGCIILAICVKKALTLNRSENARA